MTCTSHSTDRVCFASPPRGLQTPPISPTPSHPLLNQVGLTLTNASSDPLSWQMFAASVGLVCVPVLFQAPLVRALPWISLVATFMWWAGAIALSKRDRTAHWGDLLMGFTWTWLAGTIYWGWFRWEPLLHLPIESIGIPFAIWALRRGQGKIGHWFYLGSLFGTAITDVYFYLVRLLPYWRQVMQVPPTEARPILHQALLSMQTSWGYTYAILLVVILFVVGCMPLKLRRLHWYAFSGAVLSTLLVDGLFWVAAILS